ncbi:MAG: hypothetical protein FIA91_09110 [Geobacter sp.]|nr:hypothetical protein [Geobacter sp.]
MRKRTVRTGLRLLISSLVLLILGTFYSQQINSALAIGVEGATEFVKLAFFWGSILGGAAVITVAIGLLQRSIYGDSARLAPYAVVLLLLLAAFFALFLRTFSAPPDMQQKPLRPGETVII